MFLHDWSEDGLEGLKRDFRIDDAALKGAKILFASYTYEDYSGSAYVLFKRDGKLFEVEGGHCSCFGLETQWEPSETSKAALLFRLEKGYFPDNAGPEVRKLIATRKIR